MLYTTQWFCSAAAPLDHELACMHQHAAGELLTASESLHILHLDAVVYYSCVKLVADDWHY